jgi:hypothetical protein
MGKEGETMKVEFSTEEVAAIIEEHVRKFFVIPEENQVTSDHPYSSITVRIEPKGEQEEKGVDRC